jgi:hypothetical protein
MYGFMPQPLQPPFVPTALGSIPPSPFWPGGSNPLFLPVATQDMFYSPNVASWRPNLGMDHGPGTPWAIHSAATPPAMQHFQHSVPTSHHNMQQESLLMRPPPNPQLHKENTGMFSQNLSQNNVPPNQFFPQPRDLAKDPFSLDRSNGSRMYPPRQPSKTSYMDEFGSRSSNASMRDRIYHQAVSIYVDLIKHLNKSRTFVGNSRGPGHQPRYPRPPRTSQDLGHPPPPQRHHSTSALTHGRPHLSGHHRHSYIEARDHASQIEARSHIQNSKSIPWQPSQHDSPLLRSPRPSDRLHHLRREGTDPLLSSTSLIPRQDHFPVQNAVSALETLTTLCEESSWSWIEGMLLGGSLAYALADYHKAFDWYQRILAIDSR